MTGGRYRSYALTVLLLQSLLAASSLAFAPHHPAGWQQQQRRRRQSCTVTTTTAVSLQLSSSKDANGNGNDSDEISKLIGKRSQIKRQRQDDMEQRVEQLADKIGPLTELDLDSLPEFKVGRPVRASSNANSSKNDKAANAKQQQQQQQQQDDYAIIDFLADYDDENDFHIPNRLGISTAAWGDSSRDFVASSNKKLSKSLMQSGKFVAGDVILAHRTCVLGGLALLETSPSYGAALAKQEQSAIQLVRQCLEAAQADGLPETLLQMSTPSAQRWLAPWRPNHVVAGLEATLSSMHMELLELFTLPKSRLVPSAMVAKSLAAAIESGLCLYVGVEGVTNRRTLMSIQNKLQDRDVVLTSNTFEFSLTNRKHAAMIDICKSLGVIPLIRNPLDNGLASGVYTATNPSGGQAASARSKFSFKQLDKLQPLHSVLETVADRVETRVRRDVNNVKEKFRSRSGPPKMNTEITTTQVALNYIVAKGGVPLAQVNTPKQAEQVLGCLGWTLMEEEVAMLDAAAALCEL